MDTVSLPKSWPITQILNNLDQHGFAIIDQAYHQTYQHQLSQECTTHFNEFRDAAIQNGVVSHIRSDHILWIDEKLPIAQQHIQALHHLAKYINREFFLGIQDIEAHFACYNAGEFYALHRDNPQAKNGRVISTVYYLHEHWQNDWGGELHLQDKNNHWHIIHPQPNRIAIFQSDLLHEVRTAKHQRLSITAWLRHDQQIF